MSEVGGGHGTARTVIVTGPVHDLDPWVGAAESVGWTALARPLLEIQATGIDIVDLIDGLPDWICITSTSALAALDHAVQRMPELLTARFSCVGERTQERAKALGFKPALPASRDANAMAALLIDSLDGAARVLWPHGSRSSWLGDELESAGHSVLAPIVYQTQPVNDHEALAGSGSAHAILLASPSGVRAYVDKIQAGVAPIPVILAIGQTTARALDEHASMFENVRVLGKPTPASFAALLGELESTDHDS